MVMNPVDRIQTVWIRPDPYPDPDPVHLKNLITFRTHILEYYYPFAYLLNNSVLNRFVAMPLFPWVSYSGMT